MKFRGVLEDRCVAYRLGALLPERHLASQIKRVRRSDVQFVAQ